MEKKAVVFACFLVFVFGFVFTFALFNGIPPATNNPPPVILPKTYTPTLHLNANLTHLTITCDDLNQSMVYVAKINEEYRLCDKPFISEEEYFIVGQNTSEWTITLNEDWTQINATLWEFHVLEDSIHYIFCTESKIPLTHPDSYYMRFFTGFDVWINHTNIQQTEIYEGTNYTVVSYALHYNTTQEYRFRVHYWYSEGENQSKEYMEYGQSSALRCNGEHYWSCWFASVDLNNATYIRFDLYVIYLGEDIFIRSYYYLV